MHEALQPNPPRLTLEESELSLSLRAAESAYCGDIREAEAFERVERARLRRKAMSGGMAIFATIAALALGRQMLGSHSYRAEPAIRSESLGARVKADSRPARVPPKEEPLKSDVAMLASKDVALVPPQRRPPSPAKRRVAAVREQPASPANPALCRKLAADHDAEEAIRCFGALGAGTGIDAEVASYEAARLSAENSGDPLRTLRLLDEHEQRFARGVMRAEASWLRILALRRAGRLDETLARSEALLAAPEGRPFASQLRLLRGSLYEESHHDCAKAVSEFVALSGEPGARGEEAEWRRARCLTTLGRKVDAIDAHERYLARPDAQHTEEARRQLAALRH